MRFALFTAVLALFSGIALAAPVGQGWSLENSRRTARHLLKYPRHPHRYRGEK